MFSWLVLLTLMASIAYFLLFPRTDFVEMKNKPMDDVDAKQMLLVHQAAVDYAKTICDADGHPLYTLLVNAGAPANQCDGVNIKTSSNDDHRVNTIPRAIFPAFITGTQYADLRQSDIRVRFECVNADTGGQVLTCNPNDAALGGAPLAAFAITYREVDDYQEDMPMLPTMLGQAFDFKYTGKEAEINGQPTFLRMTTYCGRLEQYESRQRPPEFRQAAGAYNRLPFVVGAANHGVDAISNTRFQIATWPKNFAGLNVNQHDYVVCVTPLNAFSGQLLTTQVTYDAD